MYDSDTPSRFVLLTVSLTLCIATADIGAQIHQGSPHLFTDFALWDYQNTSSTSNVSGHCDRYDNVRSSIRTTRPELC